LEEALETAAPPTEDEEDRFERLRQWRRTEAQRQSIPPYCVLLDSVLRAIARRNPASVVDLQKISGLGARKLEQYGEAIIEVLNAGRGHDDRVS
jgi:superfamily II DNA helicase RecQ